MLFLYHLIPFLTSFPNPSDNEQTHTHIYIGASRGEAIL